jgi:inhibitor of cysteine peptidase
MMNDFDDSAQPIHVEAGETFALALTGNPTTGYTWQANVDEAHLALLGQEFKAGGGGVGAGGRQVFHFQALAPGETEIRCVYKRPWEAEADETRRFQVEIR